jgi:diadenosine tetraphosphate (Ap4A) HIT family hydrolase
MLGVCDFCDRGKARDLLVLEGDNWYTIVPNEPEIFGHLILATDREHIQNIEDADTAILNGLQEGVLQTARLLRRLKNVKRAYIAVLGESRQVHFHYHFFPRYEFKNRGERAAWSTTYAPGVSEPWKSFYSNPTANFMHKEGFQYLGEVERTYGDAKKRNKNNPPDFLVVRELARRLQEIR